MNLKSTFSFLPFLFPVLCSAQQDQLWNEIRKIIRFESGIDFQIVQGMVIGIWDQDSVYYLTYGEGLKTENLFELGSLTKPVVAYLTNEILLEKNESMQSSVCHFLPDSICSEDWQKITVENLLTHQTGLPRMPNDIGLIEKDVQDPYEHYDVNVLAGDLRSMKPSPGLYSYSQLSYSALHWLFEKSGGMDQVIRKFLEEKMRLSNMRMYSFKDELAPGFGFDGRMQPPWHTNAFALSLGLKSTIADFVSYMRQRSPDLYDMCGHLTREMKKEMAMLERTKAYRLCEGWFLIRSGKDLVFYQNGRTGGHHAAAAFMPGRKIGVVILTSGVSGSNELCFSILTMLKRARHSRK
jgi:CubicO group peptidase (beta-lactamase class C family)